MTAAALREQKLWDDQPTGEMLAESRIDRPAHTLRHVKLLGKNSRNGRTYSEQALTDATRLYQNAQVYLDHPTKRELQERGGVRSVQDLAGRIVNPKRIGDAVYGDIEVLDREPTKSLVFALAEQMPRVAGMSHRATAKIRPGTGTSGDVVESLTHVHAVELVTDPATTAGLFESITSQEDDVDLKTLTPAQLKAARPDLVEQLIGESTEDKAATKLREENERLKASLATRERADLITAKLAEAKLPAELVTEAFKKQLAEAKDAAAVELLITDRKELAKGWKPAPKPRSVERQTQESTDRSKSKGEPIEEAKMPEYAKALGLRMTITH